MTLAPPPTQLPSNIEERVEELQKWLAIAEPGPLAEYHRRLQISWIYHDAAMEGTIYELPELQAALNNEAPSDSSLVPIYDEIHQYQEAIAVIRELTEKKKLPINLEMIKRIYLTLAPDEAEGKGPQYRKDMPMHRLYFHDIAHPDKIGPKLRQLVDWVSDPETMRSMHTVRLAARFHYHFMQVYPFNKHNGKVARLLMNLMLLRNGYPPAIIHSTERQRYYESLKQPSNVLSSLVHEAMINSIESGIRYFELMQPAPPVSTRGSQRPKGKKRAKTA